jgi:hypothetical protein
LRYASAGGAGPEWLRRLLVRIDRKILPRWAADAGGVTAIELGSTNFTPEDLADPDPIFTDRPYASLLYLTTQRQSMSERRFLRSDLDLGMLGLDVGKAVQRYIHEHRLLTDRPVPEGWDHQISEGGEPTLRYGRTIGWLLHSDRDASAQDLVGAPSRHVDLQAVSDFMVGYNTSAVAGLALRVGRLATPWWSFESHPLSNQAVAQGRPRHGSEIYFWAGSSVRAVVYNAMLEGQLRKSAVTFSPSEIRHWLWENRAGWTLTLGDRWAVTYSLAFRTPEFDGPESRSQAWGGIFLTRMWD